MQILLILGVILVGIWMTYRYYLRPKWQMKRYSKLLASLGYSVYQQKFLPFGISFTKDYQKGSKEHGDALYTEKHVYPNYDLSVGNIMGDVVIFLNHPDLIKEFFYPERVMNYHKVEGGVQAIKYFLGEGIVFSQGAFWRYKRKVLSKVFTFDLLKANIAQVVQICNRKLDQIEEHSGIDKGIYHFPILDLTSSIFNGVIMKCFFGTDKVEAKVEDQSYDVVISKLIAEATAVSLLPSTLLFGSKAMELGITSRIRQLKRQISIFRAITAEVIEKRLTEVRSKPKRDQSQIGTDLIEALVIQQQRSQDGAKEYNFSNENLLDEFLTFIVAGTDTTSHFFMMMIYLIVDHPEVERKLRQQIKDLFPTDEDITYENLRKIPYIEWVQKETTRFYGPVNGIFIRRAMQDDQIASIPISKNTLIALQPMSNHFDPNQFKDPHIFRPQRWESECQNLHPFALVGFSGGPRACLGKHLAYLESKIALIKLFQRYERIKLPPASERVMQMRFLYQPNAFSTTFYRKSQ